MAPNIVEKISAITRIPTNASASGTGTGASSDVREKETPEHHENVMSRDNAYSETPYPAAYVDYHYTRYPNRWSRIREIIKECAAEFLGVMILIIFGAGVDCQVNLSANPGVAASQTGNYLSISFSWAVGTALGVWVSSGISGGHINPAVTIAFATFRDFPWRKVPMYIIAQVLGGICGAGIVYGDYIRAIDIVEGGRDIRTQKTASLFTTFAAPYMTNVNCFFDEFIATAVLLIVVCALTDRNNGPPPSGLVPLGLFIAILGIGASMGMQTGYAINPARDLGPRIMMAMVGYGRRVFTFRNEYWIWCPVIAPICGALFGTAVYDIFLFVGGESIVNRPDARARAAHAHARSLEKHKLASNDGVEGVTGPALV